MSLDCRKVVRIVPNWDGSRTSDGKYGLYAPQSGYLFSFIYSVIQSFEINFCMTGGMDILDLRTGHVVRTLIPKIAEGIFDVIAMFTKTNEYVLYYHSGRKTIRS